MVVEVNMIIAFLLIILAAGLTGMGNYNPTQISDNPYSFLNV